jgi:hypothetical protein
MLQYVPHFHDSERVYDFQDATVEVRTPDGETLAIDDPELIRFLAQGIHESHKLTLLRSDPRDDGLPPHIPFCGADRTAAWRRTGGSP